MIVDQHRERFVLIALAGLFLLAGLWAGLVRLGWTLPVLNDQFPFVHGPVMVVGFLGDANQPRTGRGIGPSLALWHPYPDCP